MNFYYAIGCQGVAADEDFSNVGRLRVQDIWPRIEIRKSFAVYYVSACHYGLDFDATFLPPRSPG